MPVRIGRRVHAIEYEHEDGRDYRHTFKPGTHLVGHDDGTLRVLSTRGRSWDRFLQRSGERKGFLTNPRGRRSMKAAMKKKKRKARGVPAWIRAKGFSSYAAYMASIRPGGKQTMKRRRAKRGGGRRRGRRRARTALAAPRRRNRRRSIALASRRSGRRRYARNPKGLNLRTLPKDAIALLMGGLRDGAVGTFSLAVARFVRGLARQDGNTLPGIAVETGIGLFEALAWRAILGDNYARAAMQGVTQGIMMTVGKGANVPYLSPALGDEGELPLLSGVYDLQGVYDLGLGDAGPLRVVLPDGRNFQKVAGGYALMGGGDDDLSGVEDNIGEREMA